MRNVTPNRFSDEVIARYLLGELPENEQITIEDEAFRDPEIRAAIEAVEQDLLDEYVRGDLPGSQRQRFQSHFLASAERKKKLYFAQALNGVIGDKPKVAQAAIAAAPTRLGFWSFLTQPVVTYGFAAAAVVLLLFGSWLWLQRSHLQSELEQLRATRTTQNSTQQQLEGDLAKERERNEQLQAELNKVAIANSNSNVNPDQAGPSKTPVSLALALLPGLSRGSNSAPQIAIGKDVATLRLKVGVDPADDFPLYRLKLRNGEGHVVTTLNKIRARALGNSRTIVVAVPANQLRAGNYEVALQGINDNGSTEALGFYYFRIVPK
jgi:hypothetical protein